MGPLSLRTSLSALIALMALTIVVGVSSELTSERTREFSDELHRKAQLFAVLSSQQLESVVAFDDRQTAREVFGSLRLDEDVLSVGIYREDGGLIVASGALPTTWAGKVTAASVVDASGWIQAVAPVVAREGPRGAVVLRISTARLEKLRRQAFYDSALVGLIAIGAALLLAWIIAGTVARRLGQIARAADLVAGGDLSQPEVAPGRLDEIGRLTVAFNAMLNHLRRLVSQVREAAATEQERLTRLVDERTAVLDARNRELEASKRREAELAAAAVKNARSAGMAEIATSVLHNIGNVLNSANVSVSMMLEAAKGSKFPRLEQSVGLLQKNAADYGAFFATDGGGPKLVGFLALLSKALEAERSTAIGELQALVKNIEHIKAIVGSQQRFAKPTDMSEPVRPRELIDEALVLYGGQCDKHAVTVEIDEPGLAPRLLDRHRITQVLLNLLGNSVDALKQSNVERRRVVISAREVGGKLQFAVSDNGSGIAPENLVKIFVHGFTTKPEGHGFGLHGSANAASEMGGSLTCSSEGFGHGATFMLELPSRDAGAAAAAA